jgi:hypothetical protein
VTVHLTAHQQKFVAREAILEIIGGLVDENKTNTLADYFEDNPTIGDAELIATGGFLEEEVAAYWLAVEDLAKARVIMEEAAAFGQLLSELELEFPSQDAPTRRRAARTLVADPATRTRAAQASGLYEKLESLQ